MAIKRFCSCCPDSETACITLAASELLFCLLEMVLALFYWDVRSSMKKKRAKRRKENPIQGQEDEHNVINIVRRLFPFFN